MLIHYFTEIPENIFHYQAAVIQLEFQQKMLKNEIDHEETLQRRESFTEDTDQLIAEIFESVRKHLLNPQKSNFNVTKEKLRLHSELCNLIDKAQKSTSGKETEERLIKCYVALLKEFLNQLGHKDQIREGNIEILINDYQRYSKFLNSLKVIFKYLDQVYCPEKETSLKSLGIKLYFMKLVKPGLNQLFDKAQELFREHFNCNVIESENIISSFCKTLEDFHLHESTKTDTFFEDFQRLMIDTARKTFQDVYDQLISKNEGTFSQLRYLQKFHGDATNFIKNAFQPQTLMTDILKQMRQVMILSYKSILLDSSNSEGLTAMLDRDDEESRQSLQIVNKLYEILDDRFELIRQRFKDFIRDKGKDIVDEKIRQVVKSSITQLSVKFDDPFIAKILQLHDKYQQIIVVCFGDNQFIRQGLKDAFENFINEKIGDYGLAEYLAQYTAEQFTHNQMKNEALLNNIQRLYSYLADKDHFIVFYQQKLAQRLLLKQSDIDDEIKMVMKIKPISGCISVKGLEDMIKEISNPCLFSQLTDIIRTEMKFDMDVKILSKSSWPEFKEFNNNYLNARTQQAMQRFEELYLKDKLNTHRQLTWMNCLSHVVLRYKKYDLHVSVSQAQILFVYQHSNNQQTIQQLIDTTLMDKEFLETNLALLLQQNLLTKKEETYIFNEQFSSRRNKIEVQMQIPFKNLEKRTLENEREVAVEAAIVKIMKQQKSLQYTDLFVHVQRYLKSFNPSTKQIKEQLEKLFRLEYIKRDDKCSDLILYLS